MYKPAKYELILSEIDVIAKKVDLFQDDLKPLVYNTLVEALVGESAHLSQLRQGDELQNASASPEEEVHDLDQLNSMILDHSMRNILTNLNDMEFSAFVAHYFTELVAVDERRDTIGEEHYIELSRLVGRKLPKRVSGTLHNAKNLRGYLTKTGRDMFELSEAGKEFVLNRVIGERD